MELQELLLYILPPLGGAVIGYITNALAIRMLFRPLRAYHIGRLRIPFTPGIIPRQRERLAESIANMVGATLLTPDTLTKHLRQPRMEQAVRMHISGYTDQMLYTQFTVKPPADTEDWITVLASDIIISPAFQHIVKNSITKGVHTLSGIRIGSLITGDTSAAASSPRASRRMITGLRHIARRGIRHSRGIDKSIIGFLPSDTLEQIRSFADSHYDELWERVIRWLKTPHMQHELSKRGRVLLKGILQRLKFMQRFLVTAGQYDKNLDEQMPRIVKDLVQQLEQAVQNPETRRLILSEVMVLTEELLDCTPQGLERRLNLDFERLADSWIVRIAARLQDTTENDSKAIRSLRIGDVMRSFGVDVPEKIAAAAEKRVLSLFGINPEIAPVEQQSAVRKTIFEWRHRIYTGAAGYSLSRFIIIDEEQKQRLDGYLTERFFQVVENKLPQVVETVDFASLVRNKVNSLDMLQVEELLLLVMQRHLKYINIFGALLGALIGAGQVALTQVL
ncbi:MAG: DUF445 family protein [Spirochaeta sp.]